jgi:hypothetical protein
MAIGAGSPFFFVPRVSRRLGTGMNMYNVAKKGTPLVVDYCNVSTISRKDKLFLNKLNAIKAFYFHSLDVQLLASKTPLSRGGTQ